MNLMCTFGLRTVAILLAIYPIGIKCLKNKYCDINCGTKLHTLCLHGNPCYTTCPFVKEFKYLTDEQRDAMLHKHNEYRNYMASGAEKQKGFSNLGISNMNILSWSTEAEYIASCIARRCEYSPEESCHNIIEGESLTCGQNVFHDVGWAIVAQYKTAGAMNASVREWYESITECDCNYRRYKTSYPNSNKYGPIKDHFTQLVWANTRFLGCSFAAYNGGGMENVHMFCNYCPSGNIAGQPYFETEGKLGPNCGQNIRYPYLCGIQRPYKEDTYEIEGKNCGSLVCRKNRNINNFVVNWQCILYIFFFVRVY